MMHQWSLRYYNQKRIATNGPREELIYSNPDQHYDVILRYPETASLLVIDIKRVINEGTTIGILENMAAQVGFHLHVEFTDHGSYIIIT